MAAVQEKQAEQRAQVIARTRMIVTFGREEGNPSPEQRSLSTAYERGAVSVRREGYHEAMGVASGTFSLSRDWESPSYSPAATAEDEPVAPTEDSEEEDKYLQTVMPPGYVPVEKPDVQG